MDIRFHYIKDLVKNEEIELYIKSRNNLAEGFIIIHLILGIILLFI